MLGRVSTLTSIAALITLCYSFDVVKVSAASMMPTVRDGDYLILFAPRGIFSRAFELRWILKRNMVVVFHPPTAVFSSDLYVKRIVGVSADQVRIQSGVLILNGGVVNEPYVWYPTPALKRDDFWPRKDTSEYVIVPAKDLFLLGDNRIASSDSRLFGPVPETAIAGIVIFSIPGLGS
jgi:signal peptidase I